MLKKRWRGKGRARGRVSNVRKEVLRYLSKSWNGAYELVSIPYLSPVSIIYLFINF